MLKKIGEYVILFLLLLPFILYVGVVITNDFLADGIETDLMEYSLPVDTVLEDSMSVAGKLVGNGNGMQYMGSILISSDLNEAQLKEHYEQRFDFIEVHLQEDERIDFLNSPNYYFRKTFDDTEKTYYSITCWDSKAVKKLGGFARFLLDLDLRGH